MSSPAPSSVTDKTANDVRKCIVSRDEKGYGLTVHGTKPVIVQSIRAGGAAWMAGIREQDEILEVNGVSVEDMTHSQVVSRIKERNTVEFMVTTSSGRRKNGSAGQHTKKERRTQQHVRQTTTTTTSVHLVSEPAPADPRKRTGSTAPKEGDCGYVLPEKVREISQLSNDTARRMLRVAQQAYQEIQQQVEAHPERVDLRQRLEKSRQQVEVLTRMSDDSGPQPTVRASVSVSESVASARQSRVSSSSSPAPAVVAESPSSSAPAWTSLSSSLVLSSQSSPSSLSPSSSAGVRPWVAVAQAASSPAFEEPQESAAVQLPLSHAKSSSMPEQSPNASTVRLAARSKSDTQEKRRPVSMDASALMASAGGGPSSPSPTTVKASKSISQPQGIDEAGDDESAATTPEPVSDEVGSVSGHRRTNSCEIFVPAPGASRPGGARLPPTVDPIIIDDPEMEEDEDESMAVDAEIKMFSDFERVLDCPALCSKLISYAFTNSKTSEGELNLHRILFIVVMRDYNSCMEHSEKGDFMKDLRRIVYEIYSTFLALQSPLNIQVSDHVRNDVCDRMRREEEDGSRPNSLKNLLRPALVETKAKINLLSRFQRDLKNGFVSSRRPPDVRYPPKPGLDNVLTQSVASLRQRMPREYQLRYMETTLGKHQEEVLKWGESLRRSAILSAIATIYKFFQGGSDDRSPYRSTENIAMGTCAPFNSKLSKSRSSVLPNFRRPRTTFNGHSLSLKAIEVEGYCEYCNIIICGTAPQAEVCHHCGMYFHKDCRPYYKKPCDRSKRSSLFSFQRADRNKQKDPYGGMPAEGRDRVRKMGSRESSAELSSGTATSPLGGGDAKVQRHNSFRGITGSVNRLVEGIERISASTPAPDDEPYSRADSFESGLGRSESLKTPSVSRPPVTTWRNKSDCSQHGEAISEAESLQQGSSSDSIGQTSITSGTPSLPLDPEVKEAEVRAKLEADPLLEGLPPDVESYMQQFGFRAYYDSLTKDGSRKGNKDLKDYQIACCEMYFQELSHLRNLKIMQWMYVEPWPQVADDLKVMMGLDKFQTLIELREELIELLGERLNMQKKEFTNMGAAYEKWLNETRSVQLKCLLGCIRYKGENHFDKLLQERYKRVGGLVERTYNKLNLFDMMISVNQHACRPSLHLSTVKKALGRLQKKNDKYTKELEVWRSAERRLFEVAEYLNDLKKKVVDLIPKIDATKLHASMPNRQLPYCYRDVPRNLHCFYFLQDVDCTVKLQQEGKSKEARLLVFEPFFIFLYIDANNPERFVLRQWERIPAVVQFSIVEHVMVDKTTKKSFMIFLDAGDETQGGVRSSRALMMSVTVTVKADEAAVDGLIKLITNQSAINKKPSADRRPGMGSSMSLSHAPRAYRSGSTVSTHSAQPQLESVSHAPKPEAKRASDAAEESGGRVEEEEEPASPKNESAAAPLEVPEANRRLLSAVQEYRRSLLTHHSISGAQYEEMVDVVATDGANDANDLLLLLLKHFQQLAGVMTEVAARGPSATVPPTEQDPHLEKLRQFAADVDSTVRSYAEPRGDHQERTPVNSVFEEVMMEDNRGSVFAEPPQTADGVDSDEERMEDQGAENALDDREEVEKAAMDEESDVVEHGPASAQDEEETAKEQSSEDTDEEEEEEEEEEERTISVDDFDGDPVNEEKMMTIAQRLVQQVFQAAMERVTDDHLNSEQRAMKDEEEEEEEEKAETDISQSILTSG